MASQAPQLDAMSRDALLDLRLCDLKLTLTNTWVEPLLASVLDELDHRGITLQPHFWLADEWFSPDGVPGVAIPFYVANPRLMKLERSQMYEVEGGTRSECKMLLRHEIGHAIDTAYGLGRRKGYRELFGSRTKPYPDSYRPRPGSKRFVQHLGGFYAQSHPAEDFAETFAVWLSPRSRWRAKYANWPALKKLEYMDELMGGIAGKKPKVLSRERPYSLAKLRYTLRTHYERKHAHYGVGYSEAYDSDLRRLFSASPNSSRPTAASLLARRRRLIRERVARCTGAYELAVDQLLREVIGRCRELGLRVDGSQTEALNEFTVLLAVQVTHQLKASAWHSV